jgi:Domain of unknown function (DUF4834)
MGYFYGKKPIKNPPSNASQQGMRQQPTNRKKQDDDDGEYVDYEEIK